MHTRWRKIGVFEHLISERIWRISAFAFTGMCNTLIDIAVYSALTTALGCHPLMANIASFSLGSVNSFWMNGLVTFQRSRREIACLDRLTRFAIVTVFCLGLSTLALHVALLVMPNLAAKLSSVIVTFSLGFVLNKNFVFVKRAHFRQGTEML